MSAVFVYTLIVSLQVGVWLLCAVPTLSETYTRLSLLPSVMKVQTHVCESPVIPSMLYPLPRLFSSSELLAGVAVHNISFHLLTWNFCLEDTFPSPQFICVLCEHLPRFKLLTGWSPSASPSYFVLSPRTPYCIYMWLSVSTCSSLRAGDGALHCLSLSRNSTRPTHTWSWGEGGSTVNACEAIGTDPWIKTLDAKPGVSR